MSFRLTNPTLLPKPEDGLEAATRSLGWIAQRFVAPIERIKKQNKNPKLTRLLQTGVGYARQGRVRDLWISQGSATATVIADGEWQVQMRYRTFSESEWRMVVDLLAEDLVFAAEVVSGHLSRELVDKLDSLNIHLVPLLKSSDLTPDCGCPSAVSFCPHVAAVHRVLADAIEGEPLELFTLRGRSVDQVVQELRERWGDHASSVAATRKETPLGAHAVFFRNGPIPKLHAKAPSPREGAGLLALGPVPGETDLLPALRPLYVAGAQAALDILETPVQRVKPKRKARKSFVDVMAPPAEDLLAAIVSELDGEAGLTGKEISIRTGHEHEKVREELDNLELLGLLYRVPSMPEARWFVG